jgi:integrase
MSVARRPNRYRVEWAVFSCGERMPFLVDNATGIPVQAATYWIVAERRKLNNQSRTLENELRSLIYLYLWADLRGIRLDERLATGKLLAQAELINLDDMAGLFMDELLASFETDGGDPKRSKGAASSGEKYNRLSVFHNFLAFSSTEYLLSLTHWPERVLAHSVVRDLCLDTLKKYRDACAKPSSSLDEREALEEAALKRLREVIEIDHPENPFHKSVRYRNYMIIMLLLVLGIRRNELLGIKVGDCNLGMEGTITIHRRPDDPENRGRGHGVGSKTKARVLAIGPRVVEIVHHWIVRVRAKIPGARTKSNYLIVSHDKGEPLSESSINKMFSRLRRFVPDLPKELTPHVLRHTWNDLFSKASDTNGIAEKDEIRMRKEAMGWDGDGTPETYLKRTTRRKVDNLLRQQQDGMNIRVKRSKR